MGVANVGGSPCPEWSPFRHRALPGVPGAAPPTDPRVTQLFTSRFIVPAPPDLPYVGYASASPVGFPGCFYRYIPTEGPTQGTVDDFWDMVWDQTSSLIVNLGGVPLASRGRGVVYWPTHEIELREGMRVVLCRDAELGLITRRDLKVTKGSETRFITQFHCQGGVGQSVPEATTFDYLQDLVEAEVSERHGPIVVHGYTGNGPVGVFIGAHVTRNRIRGKLRDGTAISEIKPNVSELIAEMRILGCGSVQTPEAKDALEEAIRRFVEGPALEEMVEDFVAAFLHPYLAGHITPDTEQEDRTPMITLLNEKLRGFDAVPDSQVAVMAVRAYFKEAVRGLFVYQNRGLTGRMLGIGVS